MNYVLNNKLKTCAYADEAKLYMTCTKRIVICGELWEFYV